MNTQLVPCAKCLRAIPVTEIRYRNVERGEHYCSADCARARHEDVRAVIGLVERKLDVFEQDWVAFLEGGELEAA